MILFLHRTQRVDGPTLFSKSGNIPTNIALITAQYANVKLNVSSDLPSSTFITNKVCFAAFLYLNPLKLTCVQFESYLRCLPEMLPSQESPRLPYILHQSP